MSLDPAAELLSYALFAALPPSFGVALWLFARVVRRGGIKAAWLRLVLGNVLVLGFLASLGFLGLESYYRFLFDTTDSFNYTLTSQKWFARHYLRNNFGCRDNLDYNLRIAPGCRRVIFLGDSFAAGHGVTDVENRFANLIRAAVPGLEVHVLAEMGNDTGAELGTIQQAARSGYQFDTVVLVYCINDLDDLVPGWRKTLESVYTDQLEFNWLEANSYFVNRLHYHWKAQHDPQVSHYYQGIQGGYQGPVWQLQQSRLTRLASTVRAAGGRLLVVTFPFLHDIGPGYEWRDVHARLAAFWAERHVPCLDLLPVFEPYRPDQLTVNRYDAHPNPLAHTLAAEAILKFLGREGALPGEAPGK